MATVLETEVPEQAIMTKALSTVAIDNPISETPVAENEMQPIPTKSSNGRYIRNQFEQKSKILQEFWQQQHHQLIKLNRDHSQLFIIIIMTAIGVLCSLIALTSNSWTCDINKNICYGLWNTCYIPEQAFNQTIIDSNETMIQVPQNTVLCAQQGLYDIKIEFALQSRIDQVTASQGLIISGCALYLFSVITAILGYRFINLNNLNSVRNCLVATIMVQMLTFFMLLIGFFLFILTERISMSVILVFIYFGLAMVASNLINFITIEYKSFKTRQISI